MRKLRIAQVAPLWFSIPPKKYGGIERIIAFLCDGLTEKGHNVTLFASGDSKTKAKLIAPVKKGVMDMGAKWEDYWWNDLVHSIAFERAKDFDVIHCHWVIMGAYFQRLVKTPVLHTMHNIPQPSHLRWKVFEHYKNDLNLVFISESERRNAPIKFKNSWLIYNGIDLSPFKFNPRPKDHFIWVARICPAKGPENAIKIAQKAGVKLLLAGQIQKQHREYFRTKIKPHLNSKIKFVGELTQKELASFYGQGKAMFYPIEWEEPFGLVMAESMACGTPVIAFRRGSVPELIEHGKTGFIVETVSEAVQALKKIDRINRADCRSRVEKHFSKEKMVNEYEKLYYKLLKN